MHTDYRNHILRQLRDQQVRFAPREKKLEQVNRAESLLSEIDPQKTYSYEYLCYRITDYRPETPPRDTMSGDAARHDLRLFVEDVSDAADIHVEDVAEPVHTVDDLSKLFKGLNQDNFTMATTGPGEPPLHLRQAKASWLPAK